MSDFYEQKIGDLKGELEVLERENFKLKSAVAKIANMNQAMTKQIALYCDNCIFECLFCELAPIKYNEMQLAKRSKK